MMLKSQWTTILVACVVTTLTTPLASADIDLYVSAPGIQTAEASGISGTISTETFNALPAGALTSPYAANNGGTYTNSGGVDVSANNQYGGNGEGNYLTVNGSGATETITFASGINYFGMFWTAGDATNRLSFYDAGNALIASYITGDLITLLPNNDTTTIGAVNGEDYYTGNYYGQPVNGLDPEAVPSSQAHGPNASEPYAYLHFLSSTADIYTVVIEKVPGGGNFESDNHSVSANASVTPTAEVVLVQSAIPEPGTCLLFGAGAALLLLRRQRR